MSKFKQVDPIEIKDNPFKIIGDDWALLTSGTKDKFNSMTISWGSLGIMWHKPVAYTFVRPQRYTKEFIDKNDYISLCFFDEKYKEALKFCGAHSGRDYDKVKETGLTPITDDLAPYYKEARLVLICKKLYSQYLTEDNVIDNKVKEFYNGDYHEMYVNEIVKALVKE